MEKRKGQGERMGHDGKARRVELFFFFQAGGGIRGQVRFRGLGNVYKRPSKPSEGASRAQREAGVRGRQPPTTARR